MKHWQKIRNYRQKQHEDGTVTYSITVDGQNVEVSPEVYKAYSQADRRERYLEERDEGRIVSLEWIAANDMLLEFFTDMSVESAEDTVLKNLLSGQVMSILGSLEPEEQQLINALILDGVTERTYAKAIGMSQKGVNKRRKKILRTIFDFLVLSPSDFRARQ
jgi:DNA-directed RNA polymerase specialized sigma24 family protein